jgi:hypothetical protein
VTILNGAGTIYSVVRETGGWMRIIFSATGVVAANTNRVWILPTNSNSAFNGFFADVMAADTSIPTSFVPTTVAAVARATDALTLAGVISPAPSTLYYRYYDLATEVFADSVAAYVSAAPIVPPVDRAYTDFVLFRGTLTAAQGRAALGY